MTNPKVPTVRDSILNLSEHFALLYLKAQESFLASLKATRVLLLDNEEIPPDAYQKFCIVTLITRYYAHFHYLGEHEVMLELIPKKHIPRDHPKGEYECENFIAEFFGTCLHSHIVDFLTTVILLKKSEMDSQYNKVLKKMKIQSTEQLLPILKQEDNLEVFLISSILHLLKQKSGSKEHLSKLVGTVSIALNTCITVTEDPWSLTTSCGRCCEHRSYTKRALSDEEAEEEEDDDCSRETEIPSTSGSTQKERGEENKETWDVSTLKLSVPLCKILDETFISKLISLFGSPITNENIDLFERFVNNSVIDTIQQTGAFDHDLHSLTSTCKNIDHLSQDFNKLKSEVNKILKAKEEVPQSLQHILKDIGELKAVILSSTVIKESLPYQSLVTVLEKSPEELSSQNPVEPSSTGFTAPSFLFEDE